MTVILVGVGADEEHVRPAPRIEADGRYEYIPIPETWLTTEERTYGALDLEHTDATAAEYFDKIRPFGKDGDWITDEDIIRNHPTHFDPDFQTKTFGDRYRSTGSTLVRELKPGDGIGFYTGLRGPKGNLHRYIYGFFTVREVTDLSKYDGREYRDRLRQFPENAHAKRMAGAGKPKHDDLVIVDGEAPAARLERPRKISRRREDRPPTYELQPEMADHLHIENGPVTLDRKIALRCELSVSEFASRLEDPSTP